MSDNKKRPEVPRVLNDLPREPWPSRALKYLCAIVCFLFVGGGVAEISKIIDHFIRLPGLAWILASLVVIGAIYWLMRDELAARKRTAQELSLYRWEAEQLRDAAVTVITYNDSSDVSPLIYVLNEIKSMESRCE